MTVANTLAYYDVATFTTVKKNIIQTLGLSLDSRTYIHGRKKFYSKGHKG